MVELTSYFYRHPPNWLNSYLAMGPPDQNVLYIPRDRARFIDAVTKTKLIY